MKPGPQRMRVVLADDHTLVRAGIRALLEKLPQVEVAGEAGDGQEVLELVEAHRPHVILMDIAMPGLNGLETTQRLRLEFPEVRVIILSMHGNEEYVWRAFRAGAAGYLLKKAAASELETALEVVGRGDIYVSPQLSGSCQGEFLLRRLASRDDPLERLTARQREVLQLIVEGENTKSIAQRLKVSPKTVEYHRTTLMARLNIHHIAGLVRFGLRAGLAPQEP